MCQQQQGLLGWQAMKDSSWLPSLHGRAGAPHHLCWSHIRKCLTLNSSNHWRNVQIPQEQEAEGDSGTLKPVLMPYIMLSLSPCGRLLAACRGDSLHKLPITQDTFRNLCKRSFKLKRVMPCFSLLNSMSVHACSWKSEPQSNWKWQIFAILFNERIKSFHNTLKKKKKIGS